MRYPIQEFSVGLTTLALLVAPMVLSSRPTIAQSVDLSAPVGTTVDPLQDFQQTAEGNRGGILSGSGSGASSVFDLIHRANLAGSKTMDDFLTEQRDSLNDEAAKFRQMQADRIRQQQVPPQSPNSSAP